MLQTKWSLALCVWLAFNALALLLGGSRVAAAAPGVGDPAPDFSLMGSDGKLYSLSAYRGRSAVVLAWFPKAFTPG